jgi:hypothetical protein
MRITQERLGRTRAIVFGIVFAIILIAFVVHRLRP